MKPLPIKSLLDAATPLSGVNNEHAEIVACTTARLEIALRLSPATVGAVVEALELALARTPLGSQAVRPKLTRALALLNGEELP